MRSIVAIVSAPESEPLTRMAAAALEATGRSRLLPLTVEVGPDLVRESRKPADGEAILLVSDQQHATGDNPRLVVVTRAEAISHTASLLDRLESLDTPRNGRATTVRKAAAPVSNNPAQVSATPASGTFLVAVTSCPTGVAHTFMAAEALRRGAAALGHEIKVETRGSVGAKNEITPDEIERASAVIVAADAHVETARFSGKRLLETGTKAAIRNARAVIEEALALPEVQAASTAGNNGASPARPQAIKKKITGPYRHLMTGVSHMLPLVVAGGLMIALAFAVGGIYASDEPGTLGWALMQIGASSAFALFVPVLAGFIAFSIADRPGLAPGLIGGMLAASLGAGFLGGIAAGFLAGYVTRWLNQVIRLPDNLQGLKPVLLLPLLTSLVTGLCMIFVIGPPVKSVLEGLTAWLGGMQQGSALLLGVLLGAMMAFDMGGPVNKAAYAFSVGLVASKVYAPMAAVMAAGMTPPLGLALAATIFRSRFNADEQRAAKAAGVLGISFITEGAIPFAASDPFRVIPACMAGSALTGALSMLWHCELVVPHGGVFVLAIPNAISHGLAYLGAIAIGAVATALLLRVLKRTVPT